MVLNHEGITYEIGGVKVVLGSGAFLENTAQTDQIP
jgi:hypothetical protein